jgi:hypothetical protein
VHRLHDGLERLEQAVDPHLVGGSSLAAAAAASLSTGGAAGTPSAASCRRPAPHSTLGPRVCERLPRCQPPDHGQPGSARPTGRQVSGGGCGGTRDETARSAGGGAAVCWSVCPAACRGSSLPQHDWSGRQGRLGEQGDALAR